MNELVTLIAALIGSSGIASVIASGTQFRRTHRLHGQLKELDAACKLMEPLTVEALALGAARASVALELTAHVLIKRSSRLLTLFWIFFALAVAAGFILSAAGARPLTPLPDPKEEGGIARIVILLSGLVIILVVQVWLMVATILGYTAHRRRRLIRDLVAETSDEMNNTKVLEIAYDRRPFKESLLNFIEDLYKSR
ncbi:hypothetical protein LJR078_001039 [Arthrobacter sp. LjRoot78]|uniref:hypothetical protein n=1 Tax=Arthrobacter sp. LjRoot78 TaxID=3342338 RepID=UPI003ED0DEC3